MLKSLKSKIPIVPVIFYLIILCTASGLLFGVIVFNNIVRDYYLQQALMHIDVQPLKFLHSFQAVVYPIGAAIYGLAMTNFLTYGEARDKRFYQLSSIFVSSASFSIMFKLFVGQNLISFNFLFEKAVISIATMTGVYLLTLVSRYLALKNN